MRYEQAEAGASEPARRPELDGLVVDHVGDLDRCKATIASLLDEYVAYVKREHDFCRRSGCPVVRSGALVVRSMLEWKAIHRDSRLGHWTRKDIRAFLLDYFPRDGSPGPRLLLDAPTCAKDLVYFMADRGTLTGDDVDVLADATDEILEASSDSDDESYASTTTRLLQIVDALSTSAGPARTANAATERRAKRKATSAARKRNRR